MMNSLPMGGFGAGVEAGGAGGAAVGGGDGGPKQAPVAVTQVRRGRT